MHEASIKKLELVVPKLVHMTLKNGKPVVAPEFWHAIRDLIHQDDNFLSLRKAGNDEYDFANEKQWRSIVSRLNNDPAFASRLNASIGRIEGNVADNITKKLPAFWDSWVANNENKISRMVGTAVDKIALPKTPKDIERRISELVKRRMNADTGVGVVVTRDEFLRHLENEFAAHRTEIRAEISELQPKLEQMVQDSIALTREDLPDGMARAEVEKLVQTLVSKSIADMNLEALARGRIHAHWDKDLRNQVNYFGVGAGAVINAKFTSQTYKPGPDDINRKGLLADDPLLPIDALMPWLDDGHCWCGARGPNRRGNPHDVSLAVMLGHSIIPQQVVMEHIIPLATTDAGARPKDVEVYASIDDPEVRSRVQDFAEAHFPDDKNDWQYTPTNLPPYFVKIGQFVYEGAELHDGVHVHHLSTELLALGAETDQVVIRATSNYGAKKHTCFYRVRLFGQRIEGPPAEETSETSETSGLFGGRWKFWK
ncbi:SUN domain-containing protein 2 [Escovopsis weberi]|uniref:SUN domain-containing protein 2 n=1 Tax=Escovopsis weberi TaxID=150374 RepID=A0A0M9VVE8_ESCWE|nr:SUN domain-containing protein 2 [Escovopsis weberi]